MLPCIRYDRYFRDVLKEICTIVDGPVNGEVIGESHEQMFEEGMKLARLHENMVVKIPMTVEGMKTVHALSKEGIQTNVTLIFSANQALIAAKAGANYVSPFIGRIDDTGPGTSDHPERSHRHGSAGVRCCLWPRADRRHPYAVADRQLQHRQ